MDNATILTVIFGGITLAVLLGDKLFGGATKLTSAFHSLDKKTSDGLMMLDVKQTSETNKLRLEILDKIELRDNHTRVGFESFTANMHMIKEALLEQRAKMSEEYMHKESFYKATDELKRDFNEKYGDLKKEFHQGIAELKEQVGALAQSVELGRAQSIEAGRRATR